VCEMGCRNDTGFTKRDLQLSDLSSETAFFLARVKPGQRQRDSRHMLCYDRWRGYKASSLMMSIAIANRMQDFEDDDIPISAREEEKDSWKKLRPQARAQRAVMKT
jgi:hypothetical protein